MPKPTSSLLPLFLTKRHVIGVMLVLLYALGMAFKGTFAKLAYQEGSSVMAVLLWRFLLSIPLFWGYAIYKLGLRELLRIDFTHAMGALAAGFFGFYIFMYADYEGLSLISVNLERMLLFTYPLFVMVLGAAFRRKNPAPVQWAALLCVQAGMLFLLAPSLIHIDANLRGKIWILTAALFHAIYVLCAGALTPRIGSVKFTTYAMTACFLAVVIHALTTQPLVALQISDSGFHYILLMVIFSTWLPTFFFIEGISRIGPNRAAIISVIGPFLTAGIAHVMLGENLNGREAVGGAIVITGIIVLELFPRHKIYRHGENKNIKRGQTEDDSLTLIDAEP